MKIRQLSYVQTIALGFLTVIAAGTILLMLPVSSQSGGTTGFVTALFTAVSASCVTGLVLVDTATYWSGFGQVVILLLIQIGGLGFMTIATLFSRLLRRRMSIRERGVMAESINTVRVGRIMEITGTIGLGTLIFELSGAVLLSIRFIPEFGLGRGIWYSVFHSVSAFCNAGFDLMGVKAPFSSLVSYSDDALVSITIMLLIVLGGIGFLVWDDIRLKGLHWRRYDLQTKLVLVSTASLILGGAVLFFFIERSRMNADMPLGEQILVSFFSSVTPRTAGFNSVDTAALSDASKLLTVILMFIGGCGGSTSGGLKVTRIILLFKSMTAVLRQKLHPRAVIQTRAGGENFSESMLLEVFCFFFIYTMSIFLWTALIAASGADIPSALGLSIATMSNSGPALGQFGATCNWSAMPAMTKMVVALSMLMGRLESFTLLILFLPSFWRKNGW